MKSVSSAAWTFLLMVIVVAIPSGDLEGQYWLGSKLCLACHNGIIHEPDRTPWATSSHHLAYADPDTLPSVIPDAYFQGGTDLQADPDFSRYNPAPVLSYDPSDPGNPRDMSSGYRVTIGNITYTVNRTHGGNSWAQLYHTKIGNSHYVLPVQYNLATDDWVAYEGGDWYGEDDHPLYDDPATLEDEIDKPDASERRCDGCHTTGLRIAWNTLGDSAYVGQYQELGVGCEVCHGPWEGGINHDFAPSDLENADRANEICGQCHNRGRSIDQMGPEPFEFPWNATSPYFLPGDSLGAFFVQTNPIDHPEHFWPDDLHSREYRQQYLDFYQTLKPHSALGEVRCFDCHDPHGTDNGHDIVEEMIFIEGADTLSIPTEVNNNTLCLACHATRDEFSAISKEMVAEYQANLDSIAAVVMLHTHHPYDPEDSNQTNGASRCSRCHLPVVARLALDYDIHSHVFEPIPPEKTVNLLSEGGMPNTCAVSCHRNPIYPTIPDFGFIDGSLSDWTEMSDYLLALSFLYYYGPDGIWWQTSTGIGDGGAGGDNLPRAYALSQNYPNPFNPSTTITFAVPAKGGEGDGRVPTTLCVYSLRGALVRTLIAGELPPGEYRINWNGKSERGEPVSSGIYLYRLEAGDFSSTRKMVVLK